MKYVLVVSQGADIKTYTDLVVALFSIQHLFLFEMQAQYCGFVFVRLFMFFNWNLNDVLSIYFSIWSRCSENSGAGISFLFSNLFWWVEILCAKHMWMWMWMKNENDGRKRNYIARRDCFRSDRARVSISPDDIRTYSAILWRWGGRRTRGEEY